MCLILNYCLCIDVLFILIFQNTLCLISRNLPTPRPNPFRERKFLVYETELLQLFASCPLCTAPAKAAIIKIEGSCIKIQQQCTSCTYRRIWSSQPYMSKMPGGNLRISSSILFTGSLPNKSLRLFEMINMPVLSISSFFRHQHHYLFPVIERYWIEDQEVIYFLYMIFI